jgi:glycosyltransferase involved in cell wall biosynthesis
MPSSESTVNLTVVIPALNEAGHIGQQLSALARQRWPGHRWEVLVVDNGSTDETVQISREFANSFPSLRIIDASDRRGLSYARNRGVSAARSDHIAICDADDVVADGWLAAMGRAVEAHEFVTGVLEVYELNPDWIARSRGGGEGPGPLFQGLFPIASGGNLGLHRQLWRRIGGFSERVPGAEDIHFSMMAWRLGIRLFIEPSATLHYRFRSDGRSLWRQGRAYGRGRALVCRDLRDFGYRTSRLAGWRSWLWLLVHLLDLRSSEGRLGWTWVAANRVGQLQGSIEARSLHL